MRIGTPLVGWPGWRQDFSENLLALRILEADRRALLGLAPHDLGFDSSLEAVRAGFVRVYLSGHDANHTGGRPPMRYLACRVGDLGPNARELVEEDGEGLREKVLQVARVYFLREKSPTLFRKWGHALKMRIFAREGEDLMWVSRPDIHMVEARLDGELARQGVSRDFTLVRRNFDPSNGACTVLLANVVPGAPGMVHLAWDLWFPKPEDNWWCQFAPDEGPKSRPVRDSLLAAGFLYGWWALAGGRQRGWCRPCPWGRGRPDPCPSLIL
jgi:hypothetical protein